MRKTWRAAPSASRRRNGGGKQLCGTELGRNRSVFFAGLVFIQALPPSASVAPDLGSNLLGALAGGLLESLSLWIGTRALALVALALYALAFLARSRRSATNRATLSSVQYRPQCE